MIRSTRRLTAIIAGTALLLTACSAADDEARLKVEATASEANASTSSPQAAEAPVVLRARPPLSDDIEAMPRLVGDTAAVQAINADLDQADARARRSAAECVVEPDSVVSTSWRRWITQPMTGPHYLTLREHLDVYCGGAYPSTAQTAVTYDLATGRRVDWAALLPGLDLSIGLIDDAPAGYVPLVSSAALGAWYSRTMLADADVDGECREVFDQEMMSQQSFNIWADAQNGGVSVQPDFPHVIQACAETATMTADDLRRFGAEPRLVEALATAQAAGAWALQKDPV